MKKYLILLVAIFAFQTNINAKEKIDCSMHLKWSIQYMSCKAGALTISVKEGVKNTSKSILPEKFETNKIKIIPNSVSDNVKSFSEKKTLADFFKKKDK